MPPRPANRPPPDPAPPSASPSASAAAPADPRDAAHLRDVARALDVFFAEEPYFLTRHHIESYDHFLDVEAASVIRSMNPINMIKDEAGRRVVVDVYVAEKGVSLDRPTLVDDRDGALRPLFPCEARLKDMTYSVRMYADVRVQYRVDGKPMGEPVELPDRVCIGAIPLLLHSRHCVLHRLPAAALREVGECPNDQGGYFVVDGKEKVIVSKEDFVQNRLYVESVSRSAATGPDKDAVVVGRMTCNSPLDVFPRATRVRVRDTKANVRPGAVTVEIDHLGRANDPSTHEQVPLFVMFRALGVESDRAIIQHVVYDLDAPEEADVVDFLRASALDAAARGIMTQRAAIDALAPGTKYGTVDDVKRTLLENLYPNVGERFAHKALLLGHVVRKTVRAALGKETLLDRDDYTNKRVRVTGALLRDLFRDLYYRLRDQLSRRLDAEYLAGPWRNGALGDLGNLRALVNPTNIEALVLHGIVTDGMRASFKGSWGPPAQEGLDAIGGDDKDEEENVVQDLNRMSYLTYVSHVRRVNNPIDRSVKLAAPHRMLASHWGAICPVESPDGPNIGLLKHLSVMCTVVSASADTAPLRDHLIGAGLIVGLAQFEAASSGARADAVLARLRGASKVYFDDTWSAVTFDPPAVVERVRAMRRMASALIAPHTSVAWDILGGELHIHMDAGRCCRPLMRVLSSSSSSSSSSSRVADLSEALDALPPPAAAQGSSASASASASASDDQSRSRWRALFVEGGDDDDKKGSGRLMAPMAPMDWVDVEELRTLMVALWPSDLVRRPHVQFTHCELHPALILSAATSTFPLLNHNNAAYNVLCLAQFKQALGVYATSFAKRMDTMGAVLHYAQRPLFGTTFADRLCAGRHGHGQNLVVAVATYTGYNMEDAIILNRDSVERGMFQTTIYKTHRFEESAAAEEVTAEGGLVTTATVFANPLDIEASGRGTVAGVKSDVGYGKLARDGMPRLNARMRERDAVLGRVEMRQASATADRQQRSPYMSGGAAAAAAAANAGANALDTTWVDRSEMAGRGQSGYVDKVLLYPMPPLGRAPPTGARVCKIRMRQMRSPTFGDKLASRFGQKGVVGMLVPARDLPFAHEDGLVPDLIINPHGFPKRMTVTHLLECLIGKSGAMSGRRYNASTFEPADVVGEAGDTLAALGLQKRGEQLLYNGRTGEQIKADVFIGCNYYGRLKHMTADKYQYRSRGRLNAIVRQPVKSANESGGLRIGEMEQNALITHGLGSFVKESMMERSDKHRNVVNARDGLVAMRSVPPLRAHDRHDDARDAAPPGFAHVDTPYAFKLLQQELQGLHVDLRFSRMDDPTGAVRAHQDDDDDDDDAAWSAASEDSYEADDEAARDADDDEDADSERIDDGDSGDADSDEGDVTRIDDYM
jgi:DNA-directed RNA polymerase II subunit RPB2